MGTVILDTSKTVATDGNTIFKYMNYVPIVIVTSHWCLVMSFWLKVCIYSHTRGVQLGLGLGFMQTSQVLPH